MSWVTKLPMTSHGIFSDVLLAMAIFASFHVISHRFGPSPPVSADDLKRIEKKIDDLTRLVTTTLLALMNSQPSTESASTGPSSVADFPAPLLDLPNEPNGPEILEEDSDTAWSDVSQE